MAEDTTKGGFTDPELESFVKENREMLERMMRQEKEMASRFYQSGASRAEELKSRAEEKTIELIAAVTDPEIHRHFMMAGFEFLMGVNAMMKAMPMPEVVKTTMELAKETREKTFEEAKENYSKKKAASESSGPVSQKIEIVEKQDSEEAAPKKKTYARKTAAKKIPLKDETESS